MWFIVKEVTGDLLITRLLVFTAVEFLCSIVEEDYIREPITEYAQQCSAIKGVQQNCFFK